MSEVTVRLTRAQVGVLVNTLQRYRDALRADLQDVTRHVESVDHLLRLDMPGADRPALRAERESAMRLVTDCVRRGVGVADLLELLGAKLDS